MKTSKFSKVMVLALAFLMVFSAFASIPQKVEAKGDGEIVGYQHVRSLTQSDTFKIVFDLDGDGNKVDGTDEYVYCIEDGRAPASNSPGAISADRRIRTKLADGDLDLAMLNYASDHSQPVTYYDYRLTEAAGLKDALAKVLYNGYPNDASGLSSEFSSEEAFYEATQDAVYWTMIYGAADIDGYAGNNYKRSGADKIIKATEAPDSYTMYLYSPLQDDIDAGNVLQRLINADFSPQSDDEEFEIEISKNELGGSEIAGAEMTLTKADGTEVDSWTSTTESHKVTLKAGDYKLVEKTAPEDYEAVTTEIEFTVADDGTVTLKTTEVDGGGKISVDGKHITLEDAKKSDEEKEEDSTKPTVKTKVSKNEIPAAADQTFTDTVSMTNLTEGVEYTITGKLMDKEAKEEVEATCKPVKFTAEAATAEETMDFTFDASNYADKELVVFETLSWTEDGEEKTVEHNDYNDSDQTISVVPSTTPAPEPLMIKVTKHWDDNNNAEGKRPDTITVNILKDGEIFRTDTLTEEFKVDDNTWEVSVPVEKDDNATYTVEEVAVDYYMTTISGDVENGFTITNYNRPWVPKVPGTPGDYGYITVAKTVSGAAEKDKAYKINVKFTYADGDTYTHTLSLKPTDGAYLFDYIPVGTKVEVSEDEKGYTVKCTVDGKDGNSVTVEKDKTAKVVVNNDKATTTTGSKNPKTGDETNIALWVGLLAVVIAAIIILVVARRKKNN